MNIYVSLTTIPSRFGGIWRTLDSLVGQTLKPSRIFLNIPKSYKRFPGTFISPQAREALLRRYGSILQINHVEEDYGPGTKILGVSDYQIEHHSMFVLADDDNWYKPDALEIIMNAVREDYAKNICSAYSFFTYPARGVMVGQGADMFAIPNVALVDIHRFFSLVKEHKSIFFHDDIWISFFLSKKNIPIKRLGRGLIYEQFTEVDGLVDLEGDLERNLLTNTALEILEELDRGKLFSFL